MRHLLILPALSLLAAPCIGQEIVKVPVSEAGVSLPEDIFGLPPGQWYVGSGIGRRGSGIADSAGPAAISLRGPAVGGPCRTRTYNLRIKSPELYQLS